MSIKMNHECKMDDEAEINKKMKKFIKERDAFICSIVNKETKSLDYDFITHTFNDYVTNYRFDGWLSRAGIERPFY